MSIIVSVVIPTYRRPKLLERCLDALINQNFDSAKYEIIIVSDGPDEITEETVYNLADTKGREIKFIQLPEKKGPAAARNYGWLSAKGAIIAFTDDDCIPDVCWLSEIVSNCDLTLNTALTGRVIVPISKDPTDYELNTANLEKADFVTANCACTKEALEKAGGFDEQFRMAWREDSELEFKFITSGISIKKVESAVVIHPVRKPTWGISLKEQKKTMFDALLYKKHPELFRKKIRSTTPVLYYAIILAFIIMLTGISINEQSIVYTSLAIWAMLTTYFIFKRLRATRLTLNHISEMVITSIIIPFVSVYWQWYGAVKYKVLFI